jgi:hypothetical protein
MRALAFARHTPAAWRSETREDCAEREHRCRLTGSERSMPLGLPNLSRRESARFIERENDCFANPDVPGRSLGIIDE